MAIFNSQSNAPKKDQPSFAADTPASVPPREAPAVADFTPTQVTPPRAAPPEPVAKESLIAADLTIEGKIEGSGHVRIAGKFKGDVNVQGNLRIEEGARLNGGVKARQVVVAGELDGNIQSAEKVEVLASSALTGDVKAGPMTVAAGSKIRGDVERGRGASAASARRGGTAEAGEQRERATASCAPGEHPEAGHGRCDPHLPPLQDHDLGERGDLPVVPALPAL